MPQYSCIPFDPEVFAYGVSPSAVRTSWRRSATRAQSTTEVPGPGSRSNTRRSGGCLVSALTVHWGTWSSSAAMFADQPSAGRSTCCGLLLVLLLLRVFVFGCLFV